MSEAVCVLVLDGPQHLCATFRATLEHIPDIHTVTEADLVGAWTGPVVAVLFVDEHHLVDDLAQLASLRERLPQIRVLLALQALTSASLRRLLDAGVDGAIACSARPGHISDAVLALGRGEPTLLAPAAVPTEDADALGLTRREAEVLRFLSAGFSNKEVARRLGLSVRTVETHRLNLRRKTQAGRLKDLVTLARQLGLPPVTEADRVRLSRH